MGARAALPGRIPVLVKLAPDMHDDDIDPIAACLLANRVDGAILTNTTVSREGLSPHRHRQEVGGLSGRPLFRRSTQVLAKFHLAVQGRLALIGVGGIDCGAAAIAKLRAGASLLQVYTGLVYRGPTLLGEIKRALIEAVREPSGSIAALVGTEAEKWARG